MTTLVASVRAGVSVPTHAGSVVRFEMAAKPTTVDTLNTGAEGRALGRCPILVLIASKFRSMANPDPEKICTSHIERQNLTMRMQIRRFTRLTNGFSKKFENHWAALALYFAYYNFCRIHSSIRVTPAMEAKITDHVWDLAELLA